jgi:hypothetical protein
MKAARSATGRAMMVATTPQGHARRSSQFAPGGEGQQQDESVFETWPLAASSGVELGDDQLANVQSTRRLRHALTSKGTGMLGMLDLNHDGALTEQEAEAALRMAGNDNTDDVKAALHKGSSASAAAALERIYRWHPPTVAMQGAAVRTRPARCLSRSQDSQHISDRLRQPGLLLHIGLMGLLGQPRPRPQRPRDPQGCMAAGGVPPQRYREYDRYARRA